MSGTRGRGAALIAATAALTLAAAGLASADQDLGTVDGVSYLSDADFVTSATPLVLDIACPPGTRPTGGGYGVGLDPLDMLRGAFPADLDADGRIDGWRVIAETGQSGTAVGTDASAICRGGKLRYVRQAGDLPTGPAGGLKLTARCPRGLGVTGGGALAGTLPGDPRSAEVLYSHPIDARDADTKPDDGWRASFYGTDQPGTKVIAICAETRQKYIQDVVESVEVGGGHGRFILCPGARHALGIGTRISGPTGEARATSAGPLDAFSGHPNDDQDTVPDDNVSASFANEVGATKTGTVYGICG